MRQPENSAADHRYFGSPWHLLTIGRFCEEWMTVRIGVLAPQRCHRIKFGSVASRKIARNERRQQKDKCDTGERGKIQRANAE